MGTVYQQKGSPRRDMRLDHHRTNSKTYTNPRDKPKQHSTSCVIYLLFGHSSWNRLSATECCYDSLWGKHNEADTQPTTQAEVIESRYWRFQHTRWKDAERWHRSNCHRTVHLYHHGLHSHYQEYNIMTMMPTPQTSSHHAWMSIPTDLSGVDSCLHEKKRSMWGEYTIFR